MPFYGNYSTWYKHCSSRQRWFTFKMAAFKMAARNREIFPFFRHSCLKNCCSVFSVELDILYETLLSVIAYNMPYNIAIIQVSYLVFKLVPTVLHRADIHWSTFCNLKRQIERCIYVWNLLLPSGISLRKWSANYHFYYGARLSPHRRTMLRFEDSCKL